MNRYIAIVAAGALVLWGSLWLLQSGKDAGTRPIAQDADEPDEPDDEIEPAVAEAPPERPAPPAPPGPAPNPPPRPAMPQPEQDEPEPQGEPDPERPFAEQIPTTEGPLDELKSAYESEPRDATAGEAEARIRAVFDSPDIRAVFDSDSPEAPRAMLRSASCHKSVCKIGIRWLPARGQANMLVMMSFVNSFSQRIAWEPVGPPDGAGVYPVDVYVARTGSE
jgi:type IV secretory pathway VirB10-like protein